MKNEEDEEINFDFKLTKERIWVFLITFILVGIALIYNITLWVMEYIKIKYG